MKFDNFCKCPVCGNKDSVKICGNRFIHRPVQLGECKLSKNNKIGGNFSGNVSVSKESYKDYELYLIDWSNKGERSVHIITGERVYDTGYSELRVFTSDFIKGRVGELYGFEELQKWIVNDEERWLRQQ